MAAGLCRRLLDVHGESHSDDINAGTVREAADFWISSDEAPFPYEAEEWRLKISVGHCRGSPEEDMAAARPR